MPYFHGPVMSGPHVYRACCYLKLYRRQAPRAFRPLGLCLMEKKQ